MPAIAADNPEKDARSTEVPVGTHRQCVLVVEPEALLRWSLTKYLSKWFRVFPTDSAPAAEQLLQTQTMDAVIVSDEISGRALEDLECHALSRNAQTRFVCTVTNLSHCTLNAQGVCLIEKPFELSRVACLLGVEACTDTGPQAPSTG